MKMRFGIRGRLGVLVVLAVLPAATLLVVRAREEHRRVRHEVHDEVVRVARQVASKQTQLVESTQQLLTGVARAPVIRSRDPRAIESFLGDLRRQYKSYSNFGYISRSGMLLASAVPSTRGAINLSDRGYYQEVLKTHDFAVGDYTVGRTSLRPQIVCAQPIIEANGELSGIVYAAIDLDWMREMIALADAPSGAAITVIDRNGVILASSGAGSERAGQTLKSTTRLSRIQVGAQGIQETRDGSGAKLLYACAWLWGDQKQDGAYVCMTVPAVAAFADVDAAIARDLRTLFLGAVVTLALAWVGGGLLIVRRLRNLAAVANQIAAGALDVKADASGGDEIASLGAVLNQVAPRLHSFFEMRHSLELAMAVQRSLLPAGDPRDDRLDIAGRSQYCDETGGDYYDFIEVAHPRPNTSLIAVGDVTGHGIASALLMASARAALRVQAADSGQLSSMLDRVNWLLASDNRHDLFMTMALLVIESDRGVVRWASAGHDPVIVFHPDDGKFEELEGSGLPLGVEASEKYEEYESRSVREHDILILGTDGIWETRNPQEEMFGKSRLRAIVSECGEMPASEIAAMIDKRLQEFRAGKSQRDDVTFVVIRIEQRQGLAVADRDVGPVAASRAVGVPHQWC